MYTSTVSSRFDIADCTHVAPGPCPESDCRYSLRPHWRQRGGLPSWVPACALEVAELSAGSGLTLEVVGALLGVTRQAAEHLENRALAKLARSARRSELAEAFAQGPCVCDRELGR